MKGPLAQIMFWALLPLAAVQGLRLSRRATRLPGAPGERQGVFGRGEDLHLLAIGDSIIDGVGTGHMEASLPVQFAAALAEIRGCRVHWRIDGASGRDILDLLSSLEVQDDRSPVDLVLVSVGVNDVTGLSGKGRWRRSLHALLDRIRARWPDASILFAGVPPMQNFPLPPQPLRYCLGLRAASLDRVAREVISGYACAQHVPTRIDPALHEFCEDGFHPSAVSCTLWAKELAMFEKGRARA